MDTIAVVFHIFICLVLIGVILLQAGKGADIGAVFGAGGSQTLFGGRGPATFLNKLTIIVAILFLLTSVWLTKISIHKGSESVIGTVPVEIETPPASAPAPAQPAAPEKK
ncbi:MAG: preprotein translocase subunit SecG [Deltaproteobacteria bacterium]|nr:preprotein translocase subunit SecG [Deltaproteobacteria bacterium]